MDPSVSVVWTRQNYGYSKMASSSSSYMLRASNPTYVKDLEGLNFHIWLVVVIDWQHLLSSLCSSFLFYQIFFPVSLINVDAISMKYSELKWSDIVNVSHETIVCVTHTNILYSSINLLLRGSTSKTVNMVMVVH